MLMVKSTSGNIPGSKVDVKNGESIKLKQDISWGWKNLRIPDGKRVGVASGSLSSDAPSLCPILQHLPFLISLALLSRAVNPAVSKTIGGEKIWSKVGSFILWRFLSFSLAASRLSRLLLLVFFAPLLIHNIRSVEDPPESSLRISPCLSSPSPQIAHKERSRIRGYTRQPGQLSTSYFPPISLPAKEKKTEMAYAWS